MVHITKNSTDVAPKRQVEELTKVEGGVQIQLHMQKDNDSSTYFNH